LREKLRENRRVIAALELPLPEGLATFWGRGEE